MIDDKHLVKRTGLAVLQVPNGVVWGKDAEGKPQIVHLVVGIAAAPTNTSRCCVASPA